MSLFTDRERPIVEAIAALADCNPFLPEWVALQRRALGEAFVTGGGVWHAEGDPAKLDPNAQRLRAVAEELGNDSRQRLAGGAKATAAELTSYRGLVHYLLFQRYEDPWYQLIEPGEPAEAGRRRVSWYARFARDLSHFLSVAGAAPEPAETAHLFALGFQVRRAFHHIFRQIYGGSLPAARLRAAVWQSIFTRDLRRYRAVLYDRMNDLTTLITGESGTGKELVAQAIAGSRYIAFETRSESFAADPSGGFFAVNLSALSPTLIESELFGHRRGAFTGADDDRGGWLEACGRHGAVFLDEIGDLDGAIQVKLLRVLQTRLFQRIGETAPRRFAGKVIAATNRDLEREIEAGRFREDLYYRICADQICTPALREQLADRPDDLRHLLLILARRIVGHQEAEPLADEVERWVRGHLGGDYPWLGNIRELEQCVRSVLIRGEYRPRRAPRGAAEALAEGLRRGSLSAEQLLQRYCALVYEQTGSYLETARRLGLDRRTVRAKVQAWMERQRAG